MSLVIPVRGFTPSIPASCYLAETATVIGDVQMGDNCSIWFNAVVRGDVNSIRMGSAVNVQDGAIIHCTYETAATQIGDDVSIGHRAIVHGCTLGNNVLIGMGAIVMDHAVIQDNALVAAGAVVLEGTEVKSGEIYAGVPAKKVKDLDPEQFASLNKRIAGNYKTYAGWFQDKG